MTQQHLRSSIIQIFTEEITSMILHFLVIIGKNQKSLLPLFWQRSIKFTMLLFVSVGLVRIKESNKTSKINGHGLFFVKCKHNKSMEYRFSSMLKACYLGTLG